ncbi:MAG: monomethylamine:corrinoid methyltransferase [Acidimicrobiia bacterium]|nr:monomethylamine:corrinoid methyltransferase [Acidimicrobiia bacterium]
MKLDRILDVLERAHTGPVYKEREFNLNVVAQTIAAKVKKFGLANTVDPENPIGSDDDLADRVYQAGFEAAVEIGVLCSDTNRAIRFSAEELQALLDDSPSEFWLGEGDQKVHFRHRGLDDPTPPVWTVPLSIVVSEDIFVDMVHGLAALSTVDCLEGPSLETVYGKPLRSGSPYEHLAGRYQADLMYEGIKRAGRVGMPMDAIGSSTTHYGLLGGYGVEGGYRPKHDLVTILSIGDFWTSYESLFKLTQVYVAGGEHISASTWVMLGGYAGGPEGTAVASVAYTLLMSAVFQGSRAGVPPFDLSYMGNSGDRAQWCLSVSNQAITRNTNLVYHSIANQVAGPGSEMLLYESLVGMTNMAVTGVTNVVGTRSAGGRLTDYLTPLEHQFAGEVFKAAAGMSRAQGNEIVKQFIPKYQDQLVTRPDGQPFQELYDIDTLTPIPEWQAMYDKVKQEAIDAGMPLS